VNDLKIGNLKSGSGRLTGINVVADFSTVLSVGDELCLKVDGNIQNGVKKIREFYSSKSYDDSVVYVDSLKSEQEYELKEERNILKLITAFSICSLLMTIMTIIGLSSYLSKTREKDNAVRSIFGCSKRELVGQLVIEFVLPIVISALVAIPVAYIFVDSWLSNYVIRIANSPLIYLAAFTTVMIIVIAVISIQAARLMRTNPSEALKKE
ncbi:MAG: ABC transporter permease, partial [Bacteroidales bacterium]|nr:ABC transporter permease [Bacteroidales bacterium]